MLYVCIEVFEVCVTTQTFSWMFRKPRIVEFPAFYPHATKLGWLVFNIQISMLSLLGDDIPPIT